MLNTYAIVYYFRCFFIFILKKVTLYGNWYC